MDLEEELSLLQEDIRAHENRPSVNESLLDTVQSGTIIEDDLGIDQPLKLRTRAHIAKIDNERIFAQRGLPYIIKNHKKVINTIKRNDKKLAKLLGTNNHYSSKYVRELKVESEFENLGSIIQFYQLWCHGLFPKARFKDCLRLVRGLGNKSAALKLYRRELIEAELQKLKIAQGITDAPSNIYTDLNALHKGEKEIVGNEKEDEGTSDTGNASGITGAEDDWSFMESQREQSLFVDLYANPQAESEILEQTSAHEEQNQDELELDLMRDFD